MATSHGIKLQGCVKCGCVLQKKIRRQIPIWIVHLKHLGSNHCLKIEFQIAHDQLYQRTIILLLIKKKSAAIQHYRNLTLPCILSLPIWFWTQGFEPGKLFNQDDDIFILVCNQSLVVNHRDIILQICLLWLTT